MTRHSSKVLYLSSSSFVVNSLVSCNRNYNNNIRWQIVVCVLIFFFTGYRYNEDATTTIFFIDVYILISTKILPNIQCFSIHFKRYYIKLDVTAGVFLVARIQCNRLNDSSFKTIMYFLFFIMLIRFILQVLRSIYEKKKMSIDKMIHLTLKQIVIMITYRIFLNNNNVSLVFIIVFFLYNIDVQLFIILKKKKKHSLY